MKRYIKDGVIKLQNKIIVKKDGMQIINPSEEIILADGWVEYVPEPVVTKTNKSKSEVIEEIITKQWNDRTDITNEEALDYMVIVYPWENFIGKEVPVGKIVSYGEKLYRVRQVHTVSELYEPSLNTASLYEVIEKEHEGTTTDPIPYYPPMEIFMDKYYIEDGIIYKCIRNSETALSHNLVNLINIYVEKV